MPSVKNPNGPSKNRLAARAAKTRKQNQKNSAAGKSKVSKADATRGAREGLLPNSGPNKAVSSKRRKKLERKMGHAMKRKMEAEGEVEMKDAPGETEKTRKGGEAADEEMAVDTENIS